MRNILFAICAATLLFTGCKENDTPLVVTRSVDSTYTVSPIPVADPHNVLVEEFTGQSCSNCPAAHNVLEGIADANTGRVNIVGMYLFGIPQADPATDHGSINDLRDSTALSISETIFGAVNQLPGAGIDRVPVSGSLQLGSGLWGGTVTTQLAVVDPLNLAVASSYNAATRVATITVTVTYTQAVSTPQNLSVVVVEDSIKDVQEYPAFDPTYPSGYDTAYVFMNVFRGMVSSPPSGDPILVATPAKTAGQAEKRTYTYTPKTLAAPNLPINPKNCRVIAFVNSANGSDYHVVQSVQTPLAP